MSKIKKRYHKPVLPIYFAALVWIIISILFPIYRLGYLLITSGVSLIVYFLGMRFCPKRVETYVAEYDTGDEYADSMLKDISKKLEELHKLNVDIPDEQLTKAMDRMEKAGEGILKELESSSDKARLLTRFANYYLPEIVNIMASYAAMQKNGVKGQNSDQILMELHKNAETMASAFENQLDALYSKEALDISTDLEVLDNIFRSQNLVK